MRCPRADALSVRQKEIGALRAMSGNNEVSIACRKAAESKRCPCTTQREEWQHEWATNNGGGNAASHHDDNVGRWRDNGLPERSRAGTIRGVYAGAGMYTDNTGEL